MLYFFLFLILAASAGIFFLVFRKRLFGDRHFRFKLFTNIGERYWIKRIKRSPKDPVLYKKLASWYLRNKKIDDAVQALQYVIELNPEDKEAKNKLEKIQDRPA
ncbi:MAG: hypothetical protein A2919_01290 [Candidatus Spechtbacteria bacterium RIFCSPLOWO2_01_FULL_43_12]|uniref:Uncharacterized protein n=1 Tax=Candidatus Spechtbacteria bacterium RIFCSPLOWO2_01_FULL_43_12 TaxID=1802162 RepID=A0A1G2HEW8_9BACT|nr:MAG: hypothetical protein A2919_01290 [Candidatus Spechtbacteria bacterium RIFCSPLOWO2_01_FULL_43_12]